MILSNSIIGFNYKTNLTNKLVLFTIFAIFVIYLIVSTSSTKNKTSNDLSNTQNNKKLTDAVNTNSSVEKYSFVCSPRSKNATIPVDNHFKNNLFPYCNLVPTPRNKWIPAKRYVESDIVFIIYTTAALYEQAAAARDTWLSRVTNMYIFALTGYSQKHITVINTTRGQNESMLDKFYAGMKIAYRAHRRYAKFYFLADSDAYVNVPHLLKRLDQFNYQEPLMIGGYADTNHCDQEQNIDSKLRTRPQAGSGYVLTASMMELLKSKFSSVINVHWPYSEEKLYSNIPLTCLVHSIGIQPVVVPGFWPYNPSQALKNNKKQEINSDPEPNTFHYMYASPMRVMDEFYVHQLLDRLENDKNFEQLIEFTRRFVTAHYAVLQVQEDHQRIEYSLKTPNPCSNIQQIKFISTAAPFDDIEDD